MNLKFNHQRALAKKEKIKNRLKPQMLIRSNTVAMEDNGRFGG